MADPFEISFAGIPLLPPDSRTVAAMARYWRPAEEWRHPGYEVGALDHLPKPVSPPDHPPRCGVLHWPTGASRWATFHQLADEELLAKIRTAVTAANTPATLKLSDGTTSLSTSMYLLPPRPLSDFDATRKLHLLTLVDVRYFWWLRGDQKLDSVPATWALLFTDLFTKLGIVVYNAEAVPSGYGTPTDRWKVHYQPLPLLLDAVAATVGMRITRRLDGAVDAFRYSTARTAINTLYTTHADRRVFGDRIAAADLARAVPASVSVIFFGNTPVADTRTLASLSLTEYTGLTAQAGFTGQVHADMPATASAGNRTGYADEAAQDWYRWRLADVEATYAGVIPWTPTGLEDAVEWGWEAGRAATCVVRPPVADPNIYGGTQATGGGDDGGFWAALVTKTPAAACPSYEFKRATEGSGSGGSWTVESTAEGPAYEVNCVDLPVEPNVADPVIVRMYPGDEAETFFLFEMTARWEFVRITGSESSGLFPGKSIKFSGITPTDDEDVLILDLN